MIIMTHEEFKAQIIAQGRLTANDLKAISDLELSEKAELALNKLCKTGGQSFKMTVPARIDDTDMIFSELIERFKKFTTK